MILRRFMQHVREQNWFAVGLDVIVVIVGIFLGLQVQQWNDERMLISEERIYLAEMHDELEIILERSYVRNERRIERLKLLNETINILSNNLSLEPLGNLHCRAIWLSSNFQRSVGKLSTVTDIQNNDRSSVFQNKNITDILSDYIRLYERWDDLTQTNRYRSTVIEKNFPEILHLNGITDIEESRDSEETFTCNFEIMQKNEAFKVALFANAVSFNAYEVFSRNQHESLLALHSEIDRELGISHQRKIP